MQVEAGGRGEVRGLANDPQPLTINQRPSTSRGGAAGGAVGIDETGMNRYLFAKKRVLGSVAVRGWVAGVLAGLAAGTVCEGAETAGGTGIIPVTIGLHAAEGETAGMGDVWIPLVRRDGGVLFLNPRASVNDRDEEEINLGLGVRRLVEGALPCIVGANVYYDGRWTRNGNRFDQLGLGVEFLSDRVDARANYYLPDRDTALVDVVETETVTETRRLRQDVETIWGDPYGAAHDIRQDYVTRLTLRETVLRETLTQVYENREAALEGWDAEIGLRLPVLEDVVQTRVFAGYQYFDNPFGGCLKGWTGRLEVRALEGRLLLDAQVFENRELNQTDWRAGARVRLPFEIGALAQGRNPFAGTVAGADAGLRARLDEMVMRDPKIQTSKSGYVENAARQAKTAQSKTKIRRREESATAVIAEGITFVDGDTGDDANPGTAEDPKATVQGGIEGVQASSRLHTVTWPDGAQRRVVYVQAAGTPYANAMVTEANVALIGSGTAIPGFGGKAFGGGTRPVVRGTGTGIQVNLGADGAAIAGFEITTEGAGLGVSSGSGRILVMDNLIRDNMGGLHISAVGKFDSWVAGNRFAENTDWGALIDATGGAGETLRLRVDDNRFENGIAGLRGVADGYDSGEVRISGNTVRDTTDRGLWFRMMAGAGSTGGMTVELLDNTAVNAGAAAGGVGLYAGVRTVDGDALVRMEGNEVDGGGGHGLYGEAFGQQAGNAGLLLAGNRVSGVQDMGIGGRTETADGESRAEASGNVVAGGVRGVSMQAFSHGDGGAVAWVEANRVTDVTSVGVQAVAETDAGPATAMALNNQVERSGDVGVDVWAGSEGDRAEAWLEKNRVSDCSTAGLMGSATTERENMMAVVYAKDNQADRCGDYGLHMHARGYFDGDAGVLLENNRAVNGTGTGMYGRASGSFGSGGVQIVAMKNSAGFNAGGGLVLDAESASGDASVMAAQNETMDNEGAGLAIRAEATAGNAMAAALQNESGRNADPADPPQGAGIGMEVLAGVQGRMVALYNETAGNGQGGLTGILAAQTGVVESGYNESTGHASGDGFGQRLQLSVSDSLELRGYANTLQGNLTGLDLDVSGSDPAAGFDLVFSSGCLLDNQDVNVRHNGPAGAPLDARGNWWGRFPPDPALIVQAGAGTIDSSDAQPVPPGP